MRGKKLWHQRILGAIPYSFLERLLGAIPYSFLWSQSTSYQAVILRKFLSAVYSKMANDPTLLTYGLLSPVAVGLRVWCSLEHYSPDHP
jgi:hypothetical protein